MEAAVTNLTAENDEVVVVSGGKFGERWEKLAQAYKCRVETVAVPWGQAPTPEQILQAVQRQGGRTRAVFFQANETSTGAYYPVESIARTLRAQSYRGLLVVDCISSLGAHPLKMDEWQIDAAVAGSQKGFGVPPGLAFVALAESAWGKLSQRPRFYFDLAKERRGQQEGRSAYTPASTLVLSLARALEQLTEIGLDRVLLHHATMAAATRAAVVAMGLKLFAGSAPSNALTAITVPAGVDGQHLIKRLRQRFGMYFAGGQDELKGKIVRFAHLGFVSRFDLLDGLAALEFALAEEGFPLDIGSGVKAAMQALARTPV